MKLMRVKTSELTGAALDWAVAKAEGLSIYTTEGRIVRVLLAGMVKIWAPDIDWAQGGPIIERDGISLQCFWPLDPEKKTWQACIGMIPVFNDRSPLVAAMRCFVASRLGDEVDVPEELLK